MRMDVCDLGKTEVILGIPWLATHNLEINWETGEVKMTRCLSLCSRRSQKKERVKRVVTQEEEKIVRWAIDNKEDWGKKEEMEEDYRNSSKNGFEVEKGVWEGRVREDANQENLGSCYRSQRDI